MSDNLQQYRGRHIWRFISVRNYIDKGRTVTFGLPSILATMYGAGAAAQGHWFWPLILGGATIAMLAVCGWIWDWRSYYESESVWANDRNPYAKEMLQILQQLEKRGEKV
jgi:hypothetical protein